jgi:thiol-disulfide isomerase/thioredoxin
MKKFLIIASAIGLFIGLQTPTHAAKIKGVDRTPGAKTVTVILRTSPFLGIPQENYVDTLNADGTFEIDIPALERLSTGYILDEKSRYNLAVFPADDLTVEIDGASIRYTGRGAEKNNFFYALNKARLGETQIAELHNRKELALQPFADTLKTVTDRSLAFLRDYPEYDRLEPEFREWFEVHAQVFYDHLMLRYAPVPKQNGRGFDSLPEPLPPIYREVLDPARLFDDRYVMDGYYNSTMNLSLMYTERGREILQETAKSPNNSRVARCMAMARLMPPRSRDFYLAGEILIDFMRNMPDTALLAEFHRTATDPLALDAVNQTISRYNETQSLIGKAPNAAFRESMLRDTNGVALSFGEMLERYTGQVVYIDFWAMWCGPCLAEMPNSKVLKEKLAGEPVAFVYLTLDKQPNWSDSFEKTFTTENHYQLEKSFESEILKFLGVNGIPFYMIFDKAGNLTGYGDNLRPRSVEPKLRELL